MGRVCLSPSFKEPSLGTCAKYCAKCYKNKKNNTGIQGALDLRKMDGLTMF